MLSAQGRASKVLLDDKGYTFSICFIGAVEMCKTLLRSNKWKATMQASAIVSEDLQQINLLLKVIILENTLSV